MTNWTELKRLAEESGGIEWHADMAVANDGAESRAIYHRPTPNHVVEIIETPDSALDNADCIHSESVWKFIAAANPKTMLALIAENESLEEELGKTELRALKFIHQCNAHVELYHELKEERDQLRAEVEALRELLRDSCEAIRHGEFSTGICCCGSSVDSHGFGDDHSPVDEGDYYASGLIERIDSALKANQ